MQLNKDQENLILNMMQFMRQNDQYFLLAGQAGVGKTTCVRYLIDKLKNLGHKIIVTAPTNKAVGVIKRAVNSQKVSYSTIYSLLGLRMMANGEIKELKDTGRDNAGNYDLVIIDESSMLNQDVLAHLYKKIGLSDTKIILIGDDEQLPPVNEDTSPIWKEHKTNYELTEVMRHQNSILDFVRHVRGNPNPDFVSTGNQVHIMDDEKFMKAIAMHAQKGMFHIGKSKVVAWRNMTVEFLNEFIRNNNETTKSTDYFVVGDRIVVKEPIILNDKIIASTDDEGTVKDVLVVHHATYPNLKAWKLGIELEEDGGYITAYTIHAESKGAFDQMLEDLKTKKLWHQFWKLKDAFHNVGYSYALTIHRSQGSTFEHVFVDAGDAMLNRKSKERAKLLYVATSRASKQLYIYP